MNRRAGISVLTHDMYHRVIRNSDPKLLLGACTGIRHFLCVLTVARHAQMKRLKAYIEQKSVLWRLGGTQIAHNLHRRFRDIG